MNSENLQHRIEAEFQKIRQEVLRPNILLAGATGAGKSSLVNLCFGSELAAVGVGAPVTQMIDAYSHPEVPVVLFDSKGYEVGSAGEQAFLTQVIGLANDRTRSPNEQIHLVWYCIQAPGSRITDFDIQAIRDMRKAGLPIAVVLTKSDLVSDEDAARLKVAIQKALPDMTVFEASTRVDLGGFDLDRLVAWSFDNLAESLRLGFVAAQRRSLDLKRQEAAKVIKQHSGGGALVGLSPIPGSDAPILLANQAAMLARIVFIYDLQKFLGSLPVMGIIGPIMSRLGLFIAGNIAKWFPGVGTAIGGMINATVAASLTFAFGTAISELCARIYEQALKGAGSSDKIRELIDGASSFLNEEVIRQLNKNR